METTIMGLYRDYIEYRGCIGIMENKMETTIGLSSIPHNSQKQVHRKMLSA